MGEGYQAWSWQQRVQITTGNLTLSTLGSLPVCPRPNLSNVFPVIFDNAVNRPSCCQPWGGYAGVGMLGWEWVTVLKERQNIHHLQKLAKAMTSAITGEQMNGEPPFRT